MNKTMVLAILVAYKAFNDKSLTIVVNEGEGEYVASNVVIDNINDNNISFLSWTYNGVYGKTININDIVGIQFQDWAGSLWVWFTIISLNSSKWKHCIRVVTWLEFYLLTL